MVGLLDVAPVAKTVPIDGEDVDVPGVSAEGIAFLLENYPQFAQLSALAGSGKNQDLAATLIALGPKILHQVLAAGLGYPGNKKAVERVARMSISEQADVLDAVLKKTLSKGLDHFLGVVQSIRATLTPDATLAEKIQEALQKKKHSSGASTSSSDRQATQPEMSGA